MNLLRLAAVSLCLLASTACAQESPPAGFSALFNGADLTGWRGGDTFDHRGLLAMPADKRAEQIAAWTRSFREHWKAANGELLSDGEGAYATTEREWGDFELRLEYNMAPHCDSGIYLRNVPQVQIWDPNDKSQWQHGAHKGSGGLWNLSPGAPGKDPLALADRAPGKWNTLRIVMIGARVSVWLNGTRTVDHAILENYYNRKQPVPPRGPIALQTHGAPIRWRRIWAREIPPREANTILSTREADKFTPIFDGRGLRGWFGEASSFGVAGGELRARGGRRGTLWWRRPLGDFAARFEFKAAPGAQANFVVRGGHQVLVGGEFARAAGEWNAVEVTARGDSLRVELNGTVISDELALKGVAARGMLGLLARGEAVALRAVRVREL